MPYLMMPYVLDLDLRTGEDGDTLAATVLDGTSAADIPAMKTCMVLGPYSRSAALPLLAADLCRCYPELFPSTSFAGDVLTIIHAMCLRRGRNLSGRDYPSAT